MDTLLPILRALREADVSFVVVGGVAVVLRGHPRLTVDLDVALDLRNADNVAEVADLEVPVAACEDLIAMKRDAGRAQDLADIEALEALDDDPTD